jgi:hypothetical protein
LEILLPHPKFVGARALLRALAFPPRLGRLNSGGFFFGAAGEKRRVMA